MRNAEKHFNLIDEPWIPAVDPAAGSVEVSLRDAFHRAHRLERPGGELPTQEFALLRVLLAILHRAVDGPSDVTHWVEIRDDWSTTLREVDAYLDEVHDRFWLRHPVHPFLQVPDLRTAKDEVFGLDRIICDGPGTSAFMTTRSGPHLERVTWAEAAGWLVHAHAFDVSGIHSGAVGDPRVKGGKGYGIGTGWAGQLGGVHVEGETLRETLLLNLVAPSSVRLETADDDAPVWERAPLRAAPECWPADADPSTTSYRQPTGPVDLYTWPTRRIRLFGDDEHVTGVINAQGDRAIPQNRFRAEPMSAWRYSEPQTKAQGQDTYMPLKHEPGRALWRGLESLLPGRSRSVRPGGVARRRPPALVEWVQLLREDGHVPDGLIRVRATGMIYGTNESVYEELVSDRVELPAALLSPDARALSDLAVEAADVAEEGVYALGSLAQNVALAAGASTESDGPRTRASVQAYTALDDAFRAWLRTLDASANAAERRAVWQRIARAILTDLSQDIVRVAGPAALVGRSAGGRHVDAGRAEYWFRTKLRELFPNAVLSEDGDGPDPQEGRAA